MLTENQQTVYDWINNELELPVYAEAYKGAIDQLNNNASGYITFVSHAGRELINRLASAALGIPGGPVQYANLIDEFQNDWNDDWDGNGLDTTGENDVKGHLIPNEICKKIKDLIDKHKEGRRIAEEKKNSFIIKYLDYTNKESIPDNLSQEWQRAKQWFNSHTHIRDDQFAIEAHNEVKLHFDNFDNFLYAAAATNIEQLRSLHEILEETNKRND